MGDSGFEDWPRFRLVICKDKAILEDRLLVATRHNYGTYCHNPKDPRHHRLPQGPRHHPRIPGTAPGSTKLLNPGDFLDWPFSTHFLNATRSNHTGWFPPKWHGLEFQAPQVVTPGDLSHGARSFHQLPSIGGSARWFGGSVRGFKSIEPLQQPGLQFQIHVPPDSKPPTCRVTGLFQALDIPGTPAVNLFTGHLLGKKSSKFSVFCF